MAGFGGCRVVLEVKIDCTIGCTLGIGPVGGDVALARCRIGGSGGAAVMCGSLWNVLARARRCPRESVADEDRRLSVCLVRRAAVRSLTVAIMNWLRAAVGILRSWGTI